VREEDKAGREGSSWLESEEGRWMSGILDRLGLHGEDEERRSNPTFTLEAGESFFLFGESK